MMAEVPSSTNLNFDDPHVGQDHCVWDFAASVSNHASAASQAASKLASSAKNSMATSPVSSVTTCTLNGICCSLSVVASITAIAESSLAIVSMCGISSLPLFKCRLLNFQDYHLPPHPQHER